MTDIAVLKTGGKQYIVKPGDTLKVEKLTADQADKSPKSFEFTDLLYGKKITAAILGQGKHKKVRIIKFKPKTNYRRRAGHRQTYTELKIEKIA